jgi:hypothetical protein
MRHGAVKGIQELVLQEVRITEVPPAPALLQAASIACKQTPARDGGHRMRLILVVQQAP